MEELAIKILNLLSDKDGKIDKKLDNLTVTEIKYNAKRHTKETEIRYEVKCKEGLCAWKIIKTLLPYITIITISICIMQILGNANERKECCCDGLRIQYFGH